MKLANDLVVDTTPMLAPCRLQVHFTLVPMPTEEHHMKNLNEVSLVSSVRVHPNLDRVPK